MSLELRDATPGDAEAIASDPRRGRVRGERHVPLGAAAVAEVEARPVARATPSWSRTTAVEVVGWASAGPYEESNPYYAGVGEAAVYVSAQRRAGAARAGSLGRPRASGAQAAGRFKLVAKVFTTNEASLRLFERAGYSEVGTHIRHGRLRGEWKDVVVLENCSATRPDVSVPQMPGAWQRALRARGRAGTAACRSRASRISGS